MKPNANVKVRIFNKFLLNFILLQAKNKAFKNYGKYKTNIQLLSKLNFLREQLNGLITKSKKNYYERMANKPNNLQRNSRPCWSLLNCFLNNKKIPLISPLLQENKFVPDFSEKDELFNSFFVRTVS